MNNSKLSQFGGSPLAAKQTSRRQFLQTTALTSAAITLAPAVLVRAAGEKAPGEKLNIAGIGVGGMGNHNINQCADENIVALCDVDQDYAAKTYKQFPKATLYRDYREMLEKQKDIDAVIIATPDHTHAMIAMEAIRHGKHVYVQKPMAYSVHEARTMTEAAREHKVVTQMGNQGHSGDGTRQIREWIQAGVIGTVKEVDAWTNRPVWPQGIEVGRPKETPPVPAGLDWDRWLGPAPYRPYHPAYVPGTWRAWCDFGTGSLGDLGCHILDAAFWAMKLKYPTSVEGCISTYWNDLWKETKPQNENFPRSTIVRYQFPEREGLPALKLTWWDGGMMPPRPDILEPDEELGDSDGGLIFRGDKGVLITGCYGLSPRVFPESLRGAVNQVPKTLDRIPGGMNGHEKDWVRACKGGKPASSNFDHSGPLSEMVLMGNLAVRFPNKQLLWDGEKMEVTNNKEANAHVRRVYREGWTL
jgi:predicted dehydrogenase